MADREKVREAQQARSKKYGIAVLDRGNLTKPREWTNLSDSQFGDPVNYRYPIHDIAHVRNARSRFAQEDDTYKGRGIVGDRIEAAAKKFKVGKYREEQRATEGDAVRLPNLMESARLLEAVEGSEGLKWEIECIAAGRSKNRKDYTSSVLQAALPLFEGLNSYANHPTRQEMKDGMERDITMMAGWITNARWDVSGGENKLGAVVGIYHALKSGPIAALLKEAWERKKPDLVQFSILGEGKQKVTKDTNGQLYYHVEAIDDLFSLDAVTKGAAGGRVRSLIASAREEASELSKIEELTREELMELRPDLFKIEEQVVEETPAVEKAPVVVEAPIVEAAPVIEAAPIVEAVEVVTPKPVVVNEPTESTWLREKEELMAAMADLKAGTQTLTLVNRGRFLNEQLNAAELPTQVKAQVRKRFEGAIFKESDLINAITENVNVWADVLRDQPREQPRVRQAEVGDSEPDRYLDAMEGMLAGEDINDVPRFRSMKEAFCTVTGKSYLVSSRELTDTLMKESVNYASWQTENLREAPLCEAITWTAVFGVSMYRRLIKEYRIPMFDEWKLIVSDIGNLKDMKQQVRERTGFYGVLPVVLAGGTYQPLTSPGEEEANFTPIKYGGLESWTWEQALNDDLGALKKIPKKLALAAKVGLYQYIFTFLRDGTTTPVTYGAAANLFSAAHANVGVLALGTAGLTAADITMRNQAALSSAATYLAIQPKYIVIPHDLKTTAKILMKSQYYVPGTIDPAAVPTVAPTAANPHQDAYIPIIVDYWTDVNRWFMVADPNFVPTIEVGFLDGREEPELFSLAENTGSQFSADKVVWKIRHVYGAGVLDHRGLYTST